ncbi:unnamed protein product [Leuciscus chuanchicus]
MNGACNKDGSASNRFRRCQRSKAFLEPRQKQVEVSQAGQKISSQLLMYPCSDDEKLIPTQHWLVDGEEEKRGECNIFANSPAKKTNCYAVPRSGTLLLEINYSSLHDQHNQRRRGQRTTQVRKDLWERLLNSLNWMTGYKKSNHVPGRVKPSSKRTPLPTALLNLPDCSWNTRPPPRLYPVMRGEPKALRGKSSRASDALQTVSLTRAQSSKGGFNLMGEGQDFRTCNASNL